MTREFNPGPNRPIVDTNRKSCPWYDQSGVASTRVYDVCTREVAQSRPANPVSASPRRQPRDDVANREFCKENFLQSGAWVMYIYLAARFYLNRIPSCLIQQLLRHSLSLTSHACQEPGSQQPLSRQNLDCRTSFPAVHLHKGKLQHILVSFLLHISKEVKKSQEQENQSWGSNMPLIRYRYSIIVKT